MVGSELPAGELRSVHLQSPELQVTCRVSDLTLQFLEGQCLPRCGPAFGLAAHQQSPVLQDKVPGQLGLVQELR